MMFNLIHPSKGRPLKSAQTFDAWSKAAKYPEGSRWLCSLDWDEDVSAYVDAYRDLNYTQMSPIVSKNRSAVDAINNAAKDWRAEGEIFIVVSDDTEPCEYWDEKIEKLSVVDDWILKTQDGIQPWMITMPVMDRAYYNRFGYIYHPDYLHMFADTELSCVADITGRKITSNLIFTHKHYSVTKEQPDAVNKKADSTWDQGEKLFLERYKRNFDLPPGKPIEDNGMINWLKKKVR